MISQATNPSDAAPTLTIDPYLGVAGALLGAMIATCTGRLMSVGLADIRGASPEAKSEPDLSEGGRSR
jgi:DHA2 family multidrug resistance protein